MRTFAIGDVHGCATALRTLLADLDVQAHDHVIFLGDYVDRGADSRQVLEMVLALGERCRVTALCGNHEHMMLWALDSERQRHYWLMSGGAATVRSYGFADDASAWTIPDTHREFLEGLPLFYETERHIFVHATPEPYVAMEAQDEQALLWRRYDAENPENNAHFSGKTIVCGHTPQRNGRVLQMPGLLCIDTFCFGGGWLSALEVETGKVWQANEAGETRYDRLA